MSESRLKNDSASLLNLRRTQNRLWYTEGIFPLTMGRFPQNADPASCNDPMPEGGDIPVFVQTRSGMHPSTRHHQVSSLVTTHTCQHEDTPVTRVSRQNWQLEGTLMTTVTRLSRHEAAARLQVSEATIDRMIKRGELATEKEPQGSRYKVWVLMGDDTEDPSVSTGDQTGFHPADKSIEAGLYTTDKTAAPSEASVDINGSEVVALRTERDGLRELVENVSQLVRALPTADTPAPEAPQSQRRRWWPFGKGNH